MLKLLLQILGWLTAHSPVPLLRALSAALGDAMLLVLRRRRRLLFSNLHHAFPERSDAWRRGIARACSHRLVESGLLSLAMPFFSAERTQRIASVSPTMRALSRRQVQTSTPTLIATLHFTGWEMQTALPLLLGADSPVFNTIFRPLDNPVLDAWVRLTRERFGVKMLSRKRGFSEALQVLRRGGLVALLFDQNAGLQGALATLFGRICSSSELPGLLVEKYHAEIVCVFPRRHGFWSYEIDAHRLDAGTGIEEPVINLNRWLENFLQADDNACASWLWLHDRWRNQDMPARRLRLEAKRDFLATDLRLRNWMQLPRKTRLWIRLPNWLGDVVMALPLLRAIRHSRPDAEITLVAKPAFADLLRDFAVADHIRPLPPRGRGYFAHFWRARREFPDCYLLFTNSFRGDLEARLTGCRQRFGLVRPGKRRPLLSHAFRVPPGFDERQHHQLELWTHFLRAFGLVGEPNTTPIRTSAPPPPGSRPIGFIAGSENNPEKRWPVTYWRDLLEALPPDRPVLLFGTANDRPITQQIAAGFESRVTDLAGRTTLAEYCAGLSECELLVTNDTGGMHLANALGVPLIALFGPTNPVRTGPVFAAPVQILQPANCPSTGGAPLAELLPTTVATAVRAQLA
ncbi:hypothetical protein K0B96_07270 [Horticoccus luteus]|uniref:ADP-heptose:LPS heptosyltransferase n=1 Tax=Horticoccus luteus TaxID=2862869 RepID=A0A8F9TW87_9BACT|nr:glycosyltransferase family 9 protein [Horticoccus luteus]QYM80399.1 hypothetical protein K0B96_07270 [Horticoccus luteus]